MRAGPVGLQHLGDGNRDVSAPRRTRDYSWPVIFHGDGHGSDDNDRQETWMHSDNLPPGTREGTHIGDVAWETDAGPWPFQTLSEGDIASISHWLVLKRARGSKKQYLKRNLRKNQKTKRLI